MYVDYANNVDGTIHVAELKAQGTSAPASSLRDVLTIPHGEENNHNGGQLQFGSDGHLYISTGDGGGSNDEHHNRLSGALVIGDVGQDKREEIDYAAAPGLGAGSDYGWNCREGSIAGPGTDLGCAGSEPSRFVEPVFDYPHEDPGGGAANGCAIIGGYVVRDPSLGDLYGPYLYGDLCTGQLRSLDLTNPDGSDRSEGLHVENLNSFGEDSCGRLYVVSGSGAVSRLVGAVPASCGAAQPVAALGSSYLGIKAASRKVERGKRALITAWVSPCQGRRGEAVNLWRGRHQLGTRHLDRVCSVRFRPRIHRRTTFHATIREDKAYIAATSRHLTLRVRHVRHRR